MTKYEIRQRQRRIIEYRRTHHCYTLRQVAVEFGITPERVRQLCKEDSIPTRRKYAVHPCPMCDKLVRDGQLYCSADCKHRNRWIEVVCKVCGKLFEAERSVMLSHMKQARYKNGGTLFCSKRCQGKYIGETVGVKHNSASAVRIMKASWVADYVWLEHLKTGMGADRLSRRLGLGTGNVSQILHKKNSAVAS